MTITKKKENGFIVTTTHRKETVVTEKIHKQLATDKTAPVCSERQKSGYTPPRSLPPIPETAEDIDHETDGRRTRREMVRFVEADNEICSEPGTDAADAAANAGNFNCSCEVM